MAGIVLPLLWRDQYSVIGVQQLLISELCYVKLSWASRNIPVVYELGNGLQITSVILCKGRDN